jgi:hypothetical protein
VLELVSGLGIGLKNRTRACARTRCTVRSRSITRATNMVGLVLGLV